jgi:hypothetical protein
MKKEKKAVVLSAVESFAMDFGFCAIQLHVISLHHHACW